MHAVNQPNLMKNMALLVVGLIFTSVSFVSNANTANNKATFKKVYSDHQQLISREKYQDALPLAKQAYDLAKITFEPLNNNRLVTTDNYALNLQVTDNLAQARVVFIELLALYETKYGKHAIELLPILSDITAINSALKSTVDVDEVKAFEVRRYKLYLRHNSDEFVKQFADQKLPTTIHAENTASKLASHFDKEFAIYESKHWSIIYPPKRIKFVKNKMAKLMEDTYKNNLSFLVSLGLRNKPIKEKMTAVYFNTRDDYISYIKAITGDSYGANASGGIYQPKARAIFFFGYGESKKGKHKYPKAHIVTHEVSHQVLYAMGFHSLFYVQPRWLKEGTAASFEYYTRKQPFGPHTNNYAFRRVLPIKNRYEDGNLISLKNLVSLDGDDEAFDSSFNQSDIYALGSMLVRFLYAEYPDELKDYLKVLSKSRTTHYEKAKFGKNIRLKQFKKAFGPPELLQAPFNTFIENVIAENDVNYTQYQAKKRAKKKAKMQAKRSKENAELSS